LERDLPIVVLWPPPADSLREFWEHPLTSADNGAALVLELGRGPARALLAADADSAVERAIAVEPGLALLKVAHHGSGSSSGARFLGRVRPLYAAISVGRFNRFGHPDRGALARLEATGARVVRTDREGALWFDLSDAGISRIDWRAGTIAVAPAAGPASRMPAHHGFVSRNRSAIDPVHLPQR
ncbi:MAG: hypothetical protein HYR73_00690, partial [Candidatus Eisenbacteria bacterium]|nr:hypothetical protein [Candidatus Eisenbacteria bacterium]